MTTTEPKGRKRSTASVVRFAVSVVLFLLAFSIFLVVLNAKREHKTPTFFGYSFSVVVTGSMEPDIRVGDLLVVRETEMDRIEVGDDILFISRSGPVRGEAIVHRVFEKETDADGIYFRTRGINNGGLADEDFVRSENFVGKAVWHSAFWGKIFGFLSNFEVLLMIAILVIVIPFAIRQVIKIVRLIKSNGSSDNPPNDPPSDP